MQIRTSMPMALSQVSDEVEECRVCIFQRIFNELKLFIQANELLLFSLM